MSEMIEFVLRYGTMCRTCGEDIAEGDPCFGSSYAEIQEGNVYCPKCLNDPSIVIHKVVKIDPESRFIFFVDKDTPKDALFDMSETIREWWKSGDRFLWALSDVTLVRLSDNGEAEVIFQEGEEV